MIEEDGNIKTFFIQPHICASTTPPGKEHRMLKDIEIKEAALLALKEWRDVVFEFNGKNYRISPMEDEGEMHHAKCG